MVSLNGFLRATGRIGLELASSCMSVLIPAPCRICGELLDNASSIPICNQCMAEITPLPEPLCQCCGRPLKRPGAWDEEAGAGGAESEPQEIELELAGRSLPPVCRLCMIGTYSFERARSFGIYNDVLRGAILLLKYEEVTRLGSWFGARLAELVRKEFGGLRFDLVVPVPIDADRRRERGYNQAELLAKPLSRALSLPLLPSLLLRTRPRPPKLLLSRSERWRSVRGAFATREGAKVDKLRILLVDDVFTTGATLNACARTLRQAGALSVCGLTVARIVLESMGPSPGLPTASKRRVTRVLPSSYQVSVGLDNAPAPNPALTHTGGGSSA
jgi:ComF family protein